MAHPAVAFDDGIVAVDFHLFLGVRIDELNHSACPPSECPEALRTQRLSGEEV
jgi:hypothetical protein